MQFKHAEKFLQQQEFWQLKILIFVTALDYIIHILFGWWENLTKRVHRAERYVVPGGLKCYFQPLLTHFYIHCHVIS